mmetsp:Transcript_10709/g.49230  ORF Transcript_10709/g.49230 Transcript_10709/m.49230 type:complete len:292 (-) Transcript_10709:1403-2278(-)
MVSGGESNGGIGSGTFRKFLGGSHRGGRLLHLPRAVAHANRVRLSSRGALGEPHGARAASRQRRRGAHVLTLAVEEQQRVTPRVHAYETRDPPKATEGNLEHADPRGDIRGSGVGPHVDGSGVAEDVGPAHARGIVLIDEVRRVTRRVETLIGVDLRRILRRIFHLRCDRVQLSQTRRGHRDPQRTRVERNLHGLVPVHRRERLERGRLRPERRQQRRRRLGKSAKIIINRTPRIVRVPRPREQRRGHVGYLNPKRVEQICVLCTGAQVSRRHRAQLKLTEVQEKRRRVIG